MSDPTDSAQPRPDVHEAARALIEAMGGARSVQSTLDAVRDRLVASVQRGGKTEDDAAAIVDDVLLPEFKSHVAELLDAMAGLYAAHLTADEMRDLEAWQRTPLGRKMLDLAPRLATESLAVSRAWGQRVVREALVKHAAELRRHGVAI